jgi:hypothetical protein
MYTRAWVIFGVIFFFMAGASASGQGVDAETGPRVYLPAQQHEFELVVEGVDTVHDFVVRNVGSAQLLIQSVKAGWGCAAVSFTRQIPPGAEGTITVKVNTRGYGGRRISKSVRVFTNATGPGQSEFNLSMTGQVDRFAEISPNRLVLAGREGEVLKQTVTIRSTEKYPFKITDMRARSGEHLKLDLDRTDEGGRSAYRLTIENTRQTHGRYVDQIRLQTDSALNPELSLPVSVLIRPAGS